MTRKLAALVVTTLLCILGAGGCGLTDPGAPRDLKFSSIAVVYGKDLTEDAWRGYDPRPNPQLLRIEFTTGYDLLYDPHKHKFAIFSRIDLCDKNTNFDKWGPNESDAVYWSGIEVNGQHVRGADQSVKERYYSSDVRTFYSFLYISIQWPPDTTMGHDELPPISYDLDKEPEDICLRVFGATETHLVFYSNTIFIPKQVIANALAAAR